MKKITTCLWFDGVAEEAAHFYTSLIKNSKINTINHYGEATSKASGQPAGSVMTVSFELDGQPFLALNGGSLFKFSPATSFILNCENQEEVDELWSKLSEGGEEGQCGWLTDKYGVTWQIVPTVLTEMVENSNAQKTERVMNVMLGMKKLEIEPLEQAYEQN